jgi:hypothetical protein
MPQRVLSFDVGTRNFAVCLVQRCPFAIIHWEVIDTVYESGVPPKGTIEEKKRALLWCLQKRVALFQSQLCAGDAVVIEQQPFGCGHGSPTMNILAHVIGAFFLLLHPDARPQYDVRQVAARAKFSFDPGVYGGTPTQAPVTSNASTPAWRCSGAHLDRRARDQLHYSSLSNGNGYVVFKSSRRAPAAVAKLLHTGTTDVAPIALADIPPPRDSDVVMGALPTAPSKRKRSAEHARYRVNKGHSVAICSSILSGAPGLTPWRAMFEASTKKDDLADAFIQALSQLG